MSNIRILVVEDESIIAMELKDRLEKLGYEVPLVVSSGEEAVDRVAALQPDLVMMDIMLEGEIDGVEATQKIHESFDTPVIYLTAYSDDSTLGRAKLTQPYGYVLKPFDERELYTTIEIALYKYQMEQKLKQNERRLYTTLKSIGDAVITTDTEGRVSFINPVAEALTGFQSAQIIDKSLKLYFKTGDEETGAPLKDPISLIVEDEQENVQTDHCVLITKLGKRIDISYNVAPIKDDKDEVRGYVLAFQDISERMRFERAMRASEERFRSLVEHSHTGILILEDHFLCVYANDELLRILQCDEEHLIGKSFLPWLNEADQETLRLFNCEVNASKTSQGRYEFEIARRDGEVRQMQAVLSAIENSDGRIQVVLQLLDVTDQKRLEQQLRHAQKMKAVGTLAGGVAHDFNNIMTAIRGCTDLVISQVDESDMIYQDLKEIQISSQRASDLTRQLLFFSRNQPMEMIPLDINKTLEDLFKMLHRLIGEDVGISTSLDPDLWNVKADRGSLEEVVMNLAINGRDAMAKGGKLSIRTDNVTLDETYVTTMPEGRPGRFVRITVEDNGEGMSTETVERIFEPFFSTKGPGKGTGLGLSVAYGIVKQHEGWINVYSEVGRGTTFKVYIPVTDEVESMNAPEPDPTCFQGNGEIVLVVEDEKRVRDLVEKVLLNHGYQVLTAADHTEAHAVLKKENSSINLLFSDVVLPDGNGIELAEFVHNTYQTIRVLLTSGYTDKKSQWEIIQERKFRFLQKPFTLVSLLQMVHETINEEG